LGIRTPCDAPGLLRGPGRIVSGHWLALPALLTCLGLGLSPLKAAPADPAFRAGLSAYNGGDYEKAISIWLPLAQQEEARSQAGLGFIYHRGLGVPVDDKMAAYWSRKAAEHGQPEGQLLLGTLYFYGQGVTQSYVRAFAWCDLAQDNGSSDAEACRDSSLQSLGSSDELQAAFQLSSDFHHRFSPRP
jgi:TPR repeat protein